MKYILTAILATILSAPAMAQTATPAPAPAPALNQDWLNMYVGPTEDTLTDLQKAHRSLREISDWVSETIADCLQFSPGRTNEKLLSVKPDFTDAGYKAYLAFLGSQPFAADLRGQTLKLITIVNDSPLLIGQGASGGRYAWMFEMPVIMTAQNQQAAKPVILRIQVGRRAGAPAPHGIVIENWQVFEENVQNPPEPTPAP